MGFLGHLVKILYPSNAVGLRREDSLPDLTSLINVIIQDEASFSVGEMLSKWTVKVDYNLIRLVPKPAPCLFTSSDSLWRQPRTDYIYFLKLQSARKIRLN